MPGATTSAGWPHQLAAALAVLAYGRRHNDVFEVAEDLLFLERPLRPPR